MSWTEGYISDVRYPAFFYKEMQPLWLSTVAAFQGFAAPDFDRPFALCELGCGIGVNLLVAAACHPDSHFVGVDFNAANLRVGRDAAAASGIGNIDFVCSDFASFVQANRQPFDFVTSHGAWSWIAPHHQASLLECAARHLTSGGLFCLHYMCHPGSTGLAPLQHVLNLCAHLMPGPSPRKAQTGLRLLQEVADGGLYTAEPAMLRHLESMAGRDPADLAHEFLTDHWQPQHSANVHQQVGRSGLSFLGSADVFNNLDTALSIPGRLQPLIGRTAVPALAETLKDMARNAHQRVDIFQKDPVPMSAETFTARVAGTRMQLLPNAPQSGPVDFLTPIGPISGSEAIFTPLLQRLAAGPAEGGELVRLPPFADDMGALLQSLQLLMMGGMAHPAAGAAQHVGDRARTLSHWFERNGVALTIVEPCATALARKRSD